jgi:hypothetical protein
MPTVADRISHSARDERSREPFNVSEPASAPISRGALAVRAGVVAAALLLALAAQLSTHEFDAGWMLALVVAFGAILAVLALSLGPIGDFLRSLGGRWDGMLRRRAMARADERFLSRAVQDPRLLAELQAAMTRQPASDSASLVLRAKVDAAANSLTPSLRSSL